MNAPRGGIAPIRPLLSAERDASARACEVHADCVTALYGGVELEVDEHLRLLYNEYVADPDWNLGVVGGNDAEAPGIADWQRRLQGLRDALRSRDRRTTVLLDSRQPDRLDWFGHGWSEAFRFSGLIYPSSRETPEPRFPSDVEVLEFDSAAGDEAPAEEIADVFEAAFGTTVEEGLDPGYRAGIQAGLERAAAAGEASARLRSTVLRIDGRAAAIGFRVQVGAVVGLYNLGVAPAFRGRRLGGAITEHRVARARAEGAEVIFLLTEDSRVEASQLKRGFVPGFELVGVVETQADASARSQP